jgi:hypothetical protein
VRDIIMGRVAELDARSRQLLETAAVIGAKVELALLDGNAEELAEALRACEGKGLLQSSGSLIRFRHDLVRQAVQEAIPAPRRIALHRRALRNMNAAGGQDPARLAHHAYGAGTLPPFCSMRPSPLRGPARPEHIGRRRRSMPALWSMQRRRRTARRCWKPSAAPAPS